MLICNTATSDEIQKWTQQIKDLPAKSTLRQEFAQGDLTLTEENGVVVFRTERGFTFRRGSLEEAVQAECNQLQRDTMCSTFELVLPDAAAKLRTRFQEVYGKRAKQIDTHVTTHDGMDIMLALLPSSVVKETMRKQGGELRTIIRGNTSHLRKISMLCNFVSIPETDEDIKTIFATRYQEGQFYECRAVHWRIAEQVALLPHSGICLEGVAEWDV
jgi:hypothetical protein